MLGFFSFCHFFTESEKSFNTNNRIVSSAHLISLFFLTFGKLLPSVTLFQQRVYNEKYSACLGAGSRGFLVELMSLK